MNGFAIDADEFCNELLVTTCKVGIMKFRLASVLVPALVAGLSVLSSGAPASAQTKPAAGQAKPAPGVAATLPPKDAAERQAEINRVIDALNSPDPATRLAGLEDVFRRTDANLRKVAMEIALSSSDNVLRGAALEQALAASTHFNVRIISGMTPSHRFYETTGGSFVVQYRGFNTAEDGFVTFSVYSDIKNNNNGERIPQLERAFYRSSRMSFGINIERSANSAKSCQGFAKLEDGSPLLAGRLECHYSSGEIRAEVYTIEIDVRN